MSGKIILKKSSEAGAQPTIEDLTHGELALNSADGKLYLKNTSNSIVYLGGGGGSSLINLIQSGFVNSQREDVGGAGIDASYIDIVLNQSPYVPVDPDKCIVTFEGGFYQTNYGHMGGSTDWVNAFARLLDGNTLRISTTDAAHSAFYFVGRWQIVELV